MYNGMINVYKEKGYTSHDVVAKMRGILKMRRLGHTGTLDPDAEGVLPICIGNATKLVDMITDKDKTYKAVIKLGITTDTQDITGKLLTSSQVKTGEEELKTEAMKYIGGYDQLPPMYSAIKVQGKRLYELARQGLEIDRKPRRVEIKDIQVLEYNTQLQKAVIIVECGKGTYIRTLIHDIGEGLGCGAAMKSLLRCAVGSFGLMDALKLSQIEELAHSDSLEPYIIQTDQMLREYDSLIIDEGFNKLVHNGNIFYRKHLPLSLQELQSKEGDCYRVYDSSGVFVGLFRYDSLEKGYRPMKMFL